MTFTDSESIDRVLEIDDHIIDEKMVECKKAVPKEPSLTQIKLKPTSSDGLSNETKKREEVKV